MIHEEPTCAAVSASERWRLLWDLTADPALPAAAKTLALVLLFQFYNTETGKCNPAPATLAEATGQHRNTIARSMAALISTGFIRSLRGRQIEFGTAIQPYGGKLRGGAKGHAQVEKLHQNSANADALHQNGARRCGLSKRRLAAQVEGRGLHQNGASEGAALNQNGASEKPAEVPPLHQNSAPTCTKMVRRLHQNGAQNQCRNQLGNQLKNETPSVIVNGARRWIVTGGFQDDDGYESDRDLGKYDDSGIDGGVDWTAPSDENDGPELTATLEEHRDRERRIREAIRTGPLLPRRFVSPTENAAMSDLAVHPELGRILDRYRDEDRLIDHPIFGEYI